MISRTATGSAVPLVFCSRTSQRRSGAVRHEPDQVAFRVLDRDVPQVVPVHQARGQVDQVLGAAP